MLGKQVKCTINFTIGDIITPMVQTYDIPSDLLEEVT